MARIEQRICDRCDRKDVGFEDYGWTLVEVAQADFDLCRSCSTNLVQWIGAGLPGAQPLPVLAPVDALPGPSIIGLTT